LSGAVLLGLFLGLALARPVSFGAFLRFRICCKVGRPGRVSEESFAGKAAIRDFSSSSSRSLSFSMASSRLAVSLSSVLSRLRFRCILLLVCSNKVILGEVCICVEQFEVHSCRSLTAFLWLLLALPVDTNYGSSNLSLSQLLLFYFDHALGGSCRPCGHGPFKSRGFNITHLSCLYLGICSLGSFDGETRRACRIGGRRGGRRNWRNLEGWAQDRTRGQRQAQGEEGLLLGVEAAEVRMGHCRRGDWTLTWGWQSGQEAILCQRMAHRRCGASGKLATRVVVGDASESTEAVGGQDVKTGLCPVDVQVCRSGIRCSRDVLKPIGNEDIVGRQTGIESDSGS
ncbi:hypothetical protein KCU62_g70, partial [Aureobasidium sp. EXF-3399]